MSFFGKIRSRSVTKRGIGKYLTYAFGEIVLVVIGILLALEINNWSEARKDRESEQVLLTGLLKEMTDNRDELVKTMSYHGRSKSAAEKISHIYRSDYRNYKDHELDSLFAEVQWCWTFDPRLGVLNSIKTTGKIHIIQNPRIQSFIATFEEVAIDSREEALTIKSIIITQYMPLVNQYISANARDKYLGVDVGGTKFPSDYKGLFNDRSAESIIGYIYFWRIDEHTEEESLLAQINEAISVVENEIKK
jgi:hypothetical protein